MTEKRMQEIAAAGRAAAQARHPEAESILTSFSAGDCYLDVKTAPTEGWVKYLFHFDGED